MTKPLTPHPPPKNAFTRRDFKNGRRKPLAPCDVQTVLRALGDHEDARALAMGAFRELGGDLNRWQLQSTRVAMADALTVAEDVIEHDARGGVRAFERSADRRALREVRRALECEVFE